MVRYGADPQWDDDDGDDDTGIVSNNPSHPSQAMVIYEERSKCHDRSRAGSVEPIISHQTTDNCEPESSASSLSMTLLTQMHELSEEYMSDQISPNQNSGVISQRGWFVTTILVVIMSYLARQPRYIMKTFHAVTGLGDSKQKCPLSIRHLKKKSSQSKTDWSHSPVEEYLLQRNIIGQDPAISVIAQEIESWMNKGVYSYGQRPLWMLFVGRDGTGKTLVAEELSKMLFHTCDEDLNNIAGVLTIEGNNYSMASAMTEIENETLDDISNARQHIFTQIVNHVSIQGKDNGAIIIINDFEQINESILKGTMDSLSTVFKDGQISQYDSQSQTTNHVDFSRTLFLFTTKKFSSMIVQELFISEGKKTSIHISNLQESINQAVEDSLRHASFSFFGHFVPFFPLVKDELFTILKLKLEYESRKLNDSQWKQLLVTDDVINFFISDVEVYKLTIPGHSHTLHIVGRGGHELRNAMRSLWKNISDRFEKARPKQVAVLEFMQNTTRMHFKWCDGEVEFDRENDVQVFTYAHENNACEEVWNGYIMS